jgi:Nuclease-related domain
MQFANIAIPLFLVLAPMGLVVAYFVYSKKRINEKRKNPINSDLLRSPGESLAQQIEDTSLDIDSYLSVLAIAPLLCYTMYLQNKPSLFNALTFTAVGLGFTVFFAYKLVKLSRVSNQLKLGFDAELAVGQELNSLVREGYYVFHDLHLNNSAEDYNIDHVVIGATGVFAVETKGRSKLVQKDGKAEFKVKFDGTQLIFPTWAETEPIAQAKRQAISLQKWLSSAIGETVEVKPVLAIPGWYIETSGKGDVAIINGKKSAGYFNNASNQKLNEKIITQIAHQLEQRCRNVKPQAYTNKKAQ